MSSDSELHMTLRQRKKKDYNKMQNGDVDGALNDSPKIRACVGSTSSQQQQQQNDNGGSDLIFPGISDEVSVKSISGSDESDDESDVELREAELKLHLMKKQHKALQKQAKRVRIAEETAELEKSLKNLQKGKSGNKKNVTAASLRSMDEVVDEVDRLMDQNMNFKCNTGSASDAESDVVSSGKKLAKNSDQLKGNRQEKKTSGKSKCLLESDCEFPQKWPHNFLNPHFVSCKDKKSYEDLSMAEFCAAYMTILEKENGEKVMHRIAHLKELMYLSTRFKWRSVLDYHGACLLEIERGQLKWGESFQLLQSTTLAGALLASNNRGGAYGSSQNRTTFLGTKPAGQNDGVIFCKGYQRGTCQQTRDHYGLFYGESRLLKHICANCWLNLKVQSAHPETSDDCPLKQQ